MNADKNKDQETVDLINYKGIYFDDDSGQKYQCPETGAHFEYLDMFRRLKKIFNQRQKDEKPQMSISQSVAKGSLDQIVIQKQMNQQNTLKEEMKRQGSNMRGKSNVIQQPPVQNLVDNFVSGSDGTRNFDLQKINVTQESESKEQSQARLNKKIVKSDYLIQNDIKAIESQSIKASKFQKTQETFQNYGQTNERQPTNLLIKSTHSNSISMNQITKIRNNSNDAQMIKSQNLLNQQQSNKNLKNQNNSISLFLQNQNNLQMNKNNPMNVIGYQATAPSNMTVQAFQNGGVAAKISDLKRNIPIKVQRQRNNQIIGSQTKLGNLNYTNGGQGSLNVQKELGQSDPINNFNQKTLQNQNTQFAINSQQLYQNNNQQKNEVATHHRKIYPIQRNFVQLTQDGNMRQADIQLKDNFQIQKSGTLQQQQKQSFIGNQDSSERQMLYQNTNNQIPLLNKQIGKDLQVNNFPSQKSIEIQNSRQNVNLSIMNQTIKQQSLLNNKQQTYNQVYQLQNNQQVQNVQNQKLTNGVQSMQLQNSQLTLKNNQMAGFQGQKSRNIRIGSKRSENHGNKKLEQIYQGIQPQGGSIGSRAGLKFYGAQLSSEYQNNQIQ